MIHNIKEFCKLFYKTTFVPISCYDTSQKMICSFPYSPDTLDLTKGILSAFTKRKRNPDYVISNSHAYYGILDLHMTPGFLILGPSLSTSPSSEIIRTFMHELMIPADRNADINDLFKQTPVMSFHRFLNTLTYLHLCLNEEELDFHSHFNILDASAHKTITSLHSNQIYEAKETENFHNTYQFEQQYLEFIKNGDIDKLKDFFLEYSLGINEGQMADNALRQAKNIFIASTTLATRTAISGGLDIEQAYQLSDTYVKECEKTQSLDTLSNLNYTMNLDFTKRVAKSKTPSGISKDIFECVQYITRHTNIDLHVAQVAKHIGRSRSYVSRKFKEELGFDLNSFIMRCKLEEAKSLLTYSDKSLSEISNYLCFSSQSYFQNVFKKKFGLTPLQYRNQTIH